MYCYQRDATIAAAPTAALTASPTLKRLTLAAGGAAAAGIALERKGA